MQKHAFLDLRGSRSMPPKKNLKSDCLSERLILVYIFNLCKVLIGFLSTMAFHKTDHKLVI